MSLPYDVARCSGVRVASLCLTCQRKTSPGRPDGPQVYISPQVFDAEIGIEQCRNYIPEQSGDRAFTAEECARFGLGGGEMKMCVNCQFFDGTGVGEEDDGECRRFPPVLHPEDRDGSPAFFCFPLVDRGWWCGEYCGLATPPGDG